MDRRRFIISTASLSASLTLPFSNLSHASLTDPALTNSTTNSIASAEAQLTRVLAADINALGIVNPTQQVTMASGQVVSFPLNMRIARKYLQYLYVWFDTENVIRVYDEAGDESAVITLPKTVTSLVDFALDAMGNLYVLVSAEHRVTLLGAEGDLLGYIGEFGITLPEQLNGPRSLTVDIDGLVHVLNAGSRTVKVFKSNGVYLFEYGQSRWLQERLMQSIDGKTHIKVKGGMLQDKVWQFSLAGELQ